MSPSKQAKKAGLKSLTELSEITHMPITTLRDWHRNYPDRFSYLCESAFLYLENKKRSS